MLFFSTPQSNGVRLYYSCQAGSRIHFAQELLSGRALVGLQRSRLLGASALKACSVDRVYPVLRVDDLGKHVLYCICIITVRRCGQMRWSLADTLSPRV